MEQTKARILYTPPLSQKSKVYIRKTTQILKNTIFQEVSGRNKQLKQSVHHTINLPDWNDSTQQQPKKFSKVITAWISNHFCLQYQNTTPTIHELLDEDNIEIKRRKGWGEEKHIE